MHQFQVALDRGEFSIDALAQLAAFVQLGPCRPVAFEVTPAQLIGLQVQARISAESADSACSWRTRRSRARSPACVQADSPRPDARAFFDAAASVGCQKRRLVLRYSDSFSTRRRDYHPPANHP